MLLSKINQFSCSVHHRLNFKINQFSDSIVMFAEESLKLRGIPSSILDISLQYGYFLPNSPITFVGFLPVITSNCNMDHKKIFFG